MSSGLERAVLRDLWSTVNQTVSGQLTKTELFLILGLIGLSQMVCIDREIYCIMGITFQKHSPAALADLKLTSVPPVPQLSVGSLIDGTTIFN